MTLGRDPHPFELFMKTHTKKGTSELIDAKSKKIHVNILLFESITHVVYISWFVLNVFIVHSCRIDTWLLRTIYLNRMR